MRRKARLFAFYLPQFHPIPENDTFWGKGFTEWTNVGKAKKLFRGHYQPHVPADLGYYDLRVPETRNAQAEMAKDVGVEGFIYWHYWFGGGKELLEKPLDSVIKSGQPDFPFALAWANESWKGFAHGLKNRNVLIEQTYPSEEDHIAHFKRLLPAFRDSRYIKVEDKLLFVIYKPNEIPQLASFISLWQSLAKEHELNGFYFIAHNNISKIEEEQDYLEIMLQKGFDAVNFMRLGAYKPTVIERIVRKIQHNYFGYPKMLDYKKCSEQVVQAIDCNEKSIPSVVPCWDHTPRSGREGTVLYGSTPSLFQASLKKTVAMIENKPFDKRIIMLKSWNEWAEGNYVEPDLKYGRSYLDAIKSEIIY